MEGRCRTGWSRTSAIKKSSAGSFKAMRSIQGNQDSLEKISIKQKLWCKPTYAAEINLKLIKGRCCHEKEDTGEDRSGGN